MKGRRYWFEGWAIASERAATIFQETGVGSGVVCLGEGRQGRQVQGPNGAWVNVEGT